MEEEGRKRREGGKGGREGGREGEGGILFSIPHGSARRKSSPGPCLQTRTSVCGCSSPPHETLVRKGHELREGTTLLIKTIVTQNIITINTPYLDQS